MIIVNNLKVGLQIPMQDKRKKFEPNIFLNSFLKRYTLFITWLFKGIKIHKSLSIKASKKNQLFITCEY